MEIVMSKHALEKARERGVTIDEIKKTIQCGSKHLQEYKILSDYMHLRVVWKQFKGKPFVIMVMIR